MPVTLLSRSQPVTNLLSKTSVLALPRRSSCAHWRREQWPGTFSSTDDLASGKRLAELHECVVVPGHPDVPGNLTRSARRRLSTGRRTEPPSSSSPATHASGTAPRRAWRGCATACVASC
jgi:hypothetical protein